jgi:hypothetical protein
MVDFRQLSLLHDARRVAKQSGKGLLRQALEILDARKRNPGLGATDYYSFGLYDREFIRNSRVEDFIGWREEFEIPLILNERTSVLPAWDKFTLTMFGRYFDLPVPRLVAFYRPGPTPDPSIAATTLASAPALIGWLRTQREWPLFVKPSFGGRGIHCYHIASYDAGADALEMKDGTRMPVEQFASGELTDTTRYYYYRREMGFLFQEVLHSHPAIRELLGNDAVSGLRLIFIQDDEGTELIAAEWKIVTGNNVIDNLRSWTTGNLYGQIDWESGRVVDVSVGDWPNVTHYERSPDTSRPFAGFVVPYWHESLALCRRAAAIFPLMRIQHWDVAITENGPRLLEVNDMGSIADEQRCGKGLLTRRLRALLQKHGDPNRYRIVRRILKEEQAVGR